MNLVHVVLGEQMIYVFCVILKSGIVLVLVIYNHLFNFILQIYSL